MIKKIFLIRSILVLCAVHCILLSCNAEDETTLKAISKPNIILILSDDQGWGATSVQMDANDPRTKSDFMQTPNLERLAERGVRFTNGYTSHSNCSPSRASIQTGKTPARLHFINIVGRTGGSTDPGYKLITPHNINGLPESETTIAEIIKQNR